MFCGFEYVQSKVENGIMITQTESAVKTTEVSRFLARKKMLDDLCDKAEIHGFRGVWQHELAGWSNASGHLVECHNCRKPCLNFLSLRFVVVFTSILI